MEGKVAVLGDIDFVMPFSTLGLDGFSVGHQAGQVVENAKKIIEGKYVLVIVAENVAAQAEEVFCDVQKMPTPCVLVLPFTAEATGFATKALGEVLKMATGIDILKNN